MYPKIKKKQISQITKLQEKIYKFDKTHCYGYNRRRIFIRLYKKMFNTKKAITEFTSLAHAKKLKKVKEMLKILSKKSSFFADIQNHFNTQKDIQENALDALYSMVMNIAYQQNT